MTIARQQFGLHGEDLAVRALERAGYAILARRYRVRAGEIDIVALDGRCLVFVEVKSRQNGRFGGAAVAVTPWKRRKIVAVATEYLARHRVSDQPCRFDVVSIQMNAGQPEIEVFQGAFDATGD